MDDDTFVARALVALAERAPIEPVGLATTVEHRFVRRRRRRWIASGIAAATAVALAIGVPVLDSGGGSPAWHLAAPGTILPPIEQVWPGMVFHPPTKPLAGDAPSLQRRIDATHLLVTSGMPHTETEPSPVTVPLAVYDTVRQTYRQLTQLSYDQMGAFDLSLAVTDQWVVWAERSDTSNRSWIYRVPVGGGDVQRVATLNGFPDALFATDTAIYWSEPGPGYGIMRMSISGGPAEAVPADAGMILAYPRSPWASLVTTNGPRSERLTTGHDLYITHKLRNVVTGQEIDVRVPPGTTSLQCTPELCVGNAAGVDETGAFIQRPDGSDRSPLPLGGGDPVVPYPAADRTLLIAFHPDAVNTEWCAVEDPSTGRAGILAPHEGMFVAFNFGDGTLIQYDPHGVTPPSPTFELDGVS